MIFPLKLREPNISIYGSNKFANIIKKGIMPGMKNFKFFTCVQKHFANRTSRKKVK